jgi:hypothetical protein
MIASTPARFKSKTSPAFAISFKKDWRTSCFKKFVARKYHVHGFASAVADAAAVKLRLAKVQMAAIGFPARVKKIHTPRRRLPLTIIRHDAVAVKIRHADQNLGSVINDILPIHNQRL